MKHLLRKEIQNSIIWEVLLIAVFLYVSSIYFAKLPMTDFPAGDFGRDLYVYYLVSVGKLPYVDFNYIYGPLMPIIYGIVFKIFGPSILNALIVWYCIYLGCIITLFYLVKRFSNGILAFVAGLLFIAYYGFYFHTFNHLSGALFILLMCLFLKIYYDTENHKYLWLTYISAFLICVTKLNMGIVLSGLLLAVSFAFDVLEKKRLQNIIYISIGYIFSIILVYGSLLLFHPYDQLQKSFPYSKNYLVEYDKTLLQAIFSSDNMLLSFGNGRPAFYTDLYLLFSSNALYFLVGLASLLLSLYILKKDIKNKDGKYILFCSLFCLFSTHEFVVIYSNWSLRQWTLPIAIILVCLLIKYFYDQLHSKKYFKTAFTIFCVLFSIVLFIKLDSIIYYQTFKSKYCPLERAKVSFSYEYWSYMLAQVDEYIKNNTSPGEKVLSVPNKIIYNFLTKRDHPSRIFEFYYYSNLSEKDQDKIIEDLEKQKVRVILFGIRNEDIKMGVGNFGITHCQKLYKYILDNYETDIVLKFQNKNIKYVDPIAFFKRKTPFKPGTSKPVGD